MEEQQPGIATSGADALAAAIVANGAEADSSLKAQASQLLEKQSALVDEQVRVLRLQARDLEREDTLRHRSLFARYASEVMKVAFEVSAAVAFTAVVVLLAVAIWQAAHESGVAIEPFSVPSDLAGRGLTGQAVAAQVQDRLLGMQHTTDAITGRKPSSYSLNWGNDIRVQIPNTGISVHEFYRLLVSWFGHETRITGEVFRTPAGLAVSARVGGDAGDTVEGKESDLRALLQATAENIYRITQPYRYARFLQPRLGAANPRTVAILQQLARDAPNSERAWALASLASPAISGSFDKSLALQKRAVALDPRNPNAFYGLANLEESKGHYRAGTALRRKVDAMLRPGATDQLTERARVGSYWRNRTRLETLICDYAAALRDAEGASDLPGVGNNIDLIRLTAAALASQMHDKVLFERELAARNAHPGNARGYLVPSQEKSTVLLVSLTGAFNLEDWDRVVALAPAYAAVLAQANPPGALGDLLSNNQRPWLAMALARLGRFREADAVIAPAPADNELATLARAVVAALERHWPEADRYFASLAAQTPSPLIDRYWGESYLMRGRPDLAVARLARAHSIMPRFADPLELWGEALMLENRSDLALAKFGEAAKYTPNWGRLHLKWGEALWFAGDKVKAKHELARAVHLYLTADEQRELARVRSQHG